MNKSFDTLSCIVREQLGEAPPSDSLFVFRSRRPDRVNLLCWGLDGYVLCAKCLENVTIQFLTGAGDTQGVTITSTDLALILTGIVLNHARRLGHYGRAGRPVSVS